ncbi:glycosyltransferase family 4 protein [Cellulophaga sp. BC115SP]|uniref:glycosyltransferase family 4 protein n=1 Tax=Cellulophaga sp. BC115SP TaxID=2683263 RepID=UPI0014133952|nr:glycosyltransferase family 4 protein [Cellulophaga sp. BC115SP]NBB31845.1 glycosyltransferase [Cellulophaga sp. BC115SP]
MKKYTCPDTVDKERILFLLHLPPPVHGSSQVGQWISDSVLINASFNCRYINLLASKSVDDTGRLSFSKVYNAFRLFFKVLCCIILFRPHKVYFALTTTGFAFYRDVIIVSILKIFRLKIFFHLHNKGIKSASKSKINFILYKYIFENAKVIILSKFLYDDIQCFVNEQNVEICANGIPNLKLLNSDKNYKDIKPLRILFLSNLIESKGVLVLLNALVILRKREVKFEAVFVGGGGDISSTQLEQFILDMDLSENVSYLGKRYDVEKQEIFESSDLFVFPTYYKNECFPLVLLEAMQFSLPIITTSEGGIKSIVEEGKTGFVIPQKDPQKLADKIEYLIQHPILLKDMRANAYRRYLELFTFERFENRIMEILSNK